MNEPSIVAKVVLGLLLLVPLAIIGGLLYQACYSFSSRSRQEERLLEMEAEESQVN